MSVDAIAEVDVSPVQAAAPVRSEREPMLNPGGWLCHTDLDVEDGSFHGPEVDVHHGFERGTIRSWLAAAGFVDVSVGDCCDVEHGGRSYSTFIAACRKPHQ